MRARWPSHMNLFSDLSVFFLLCVRQRHWYRKTLRQLNTWKYFTLILKAWCWIEGAKRRKIWAFFGHEGQPQHWVTMLDIPLYQALGNRKGRKAKEKSHDGIKYSSHAQRIQTSLGLTLPLNWKHQLTEQVPSAFIVTGTKRLLGVTGIVFLQRRMQSGLNYELFWKLLHEIMRQFL